MPRSYPPEFRRKVLDLITAGRTVADDLCGPRGERPDGLQLAQLGSDRPRRAPRSEEPEHAELAEARRRIAELETELAGTKRANELWKRGGAPMKNASRRSPRWLRMATRPRSVAASWPSPSPASTTGARGNRRHALSAMPCSRT